MSKIKDAFTKGKAFIPFISAGDHGIETTERYIRVMVKAGADMVLMPENFEEAYQGVLDAVVDGTVSEERIDDSLRRIYRVKLRSRVL